MLMLFAQILYFVTKGIFIFIVISALAVVTYGLILEIKEKYLNYKINKDHK